MGKWGLLVLAYTIMEFNIVQILASEPGLIVLV